MSHYLLFFGIVALVFGLYMRRQDHLRYSMSDLAPVWLYTLLAMPMAFVVTVLTFIAKHI